MSTQMTSTLDGLSLDLLIQIAAHLDITDVIRLRQTSKQLRNIISSRDFWGVLYKSSSLPRPLGPHHEQPQQVLEDSLLRSFRVHKNLFITPKQPQSRMYDLGQEKGLVAGGKWALTFNLARTQIICRDLDLEGSGPVVVREIEDESDFKFWTMHFFNGMTHSGKNISLVLLEQRVKDHNELVAVVNSPIKLEVLRVFEPEIPGVGVHFEKIYQHSSVVTNSIRTPKFCASFSPNALVTQWKGGENKVFVWNVDDLGGGPIAVAHLPLEPSQSLSFLCCKTHLISLLDSRLGDGIIVEVTPLQAVFEDAPRPAASGFIHDRMFESVKVLHDSAVDPETGSTEVILAGHELGLEQESANKFVIIKLRIPLGVVGDHSQGDILVDAQDLVTLPIGTQGMLYSSAWNGSTRLVYSRKEPSMDNREIDDDEQEAEDNQDFNDELNFDNEWDTGLTMAWVMGWSRGPWRTRISIVEVVYDGEARKGRCITASDVPIPDDVRDKFDGEPGGAMFKVFENEVGSGRLTYIYLVAYNRSMTYGLGVLDFA